jgi:hypothetical protein
LECGGFSTAFGEKSRQTPDAAPDVQQQTEVAQYLQLLTNSCPVLFRGYRARGGWRQFGFRFYFSL